MEHQVDFETLYLPNKNNFLSDVKCEPKNQNDVHKVLAKHGINLENSLFCIEIKPFKCSFCEIRFGFSTNLDNQLMEHFRENHLDKLIKVEPQIDIGDTISDYSMDSAPQEEPIETLNVEEFSDLKNKYQCPVCSASYNFSTSLKKHMSQHEERKFKCTDCSLEFRKKGALVTHQAIHKPPEFECDECSMQFIWYQSFAKHKLDIHGTKLNGKRNYVKMKHKKAMKIVKNSSTIECKQEISIDDEVPDENLNSTEFVNVGFKQEPNLPYKFEQSFVYPDCFPTFTKEELIEKNVYESQSIKCFECDETFCNKKELFKHRSDFHGMIEDVHSISKQLDECSDKKYIKCCDQFFERSSNLYNEHLKLVHKKNKKKFSSVHICNVCNKSFGNKRIFRQHTYTHDEHKFKCVFCDKKFSTHQSLSYHERTFHKDVYHSIHTECKICRIRLKTDVELKKHVKYVHQNEKFICDHCDRSFEKKLGLICHINYMHVRDKLYKCDTCFNSYSSQKKLDIHMIRIHGAALKNEIISNENILFQCSICFEKFANEEFLRAHQEKQASIKCEECSLTFCNLKNCFIHKSKTHNIQKDEYYTKCELCTRIISNTAMSSHNSKCHNVKKTESDEQQKFKCDQCGKQYVTKSYLTSHMQTHGEPKYECTSCGKKFFVERYLVEHIRIKHKDIKFPCNICGKIFEIERRLDIHIQKHAEDNMTTECTYCNKNFKTKTKVREHIAEVHEKLKNWKCNLCDKAFSIRHRLNMHYKNSHSTENIFHCEICGKIIKRKSLLKSHMLLHMDIKEFECDVCQKRFQTKNHLNNHKRIHSDERPYVCKECGKAFKQYISLFLHNRRHKGIKPYKCTLCDMSFYQPNMLKTHMVYHTGERNYHCLPCNKSYMSPDCLNKHKKRHHSIDKIKIPLNSLQPEDIDKNEQQN